MSNIQAQLSTSAAGFRVEGYEKIELNFQLVDQIFDIRKPELANCYTPFKRCLAIVDQTVYHWYGSQLQQYFQYYDIQLTVFPVVIQEPDKTLDTFETIVDLKWFEIPFHSSFQSVLTDFSFEPELEFTAQENLPILL